MNKTVNINIGGLFFNVDENAFQKLSRYFDAIKRSLSNAGGQEEIMKDIEMRVAELLQEKQLSDKHVVNLADVDAVVAVMGQPEDYRIDDEETGTAGSTSSFSNTISKKLYRDKDNGLIGGVCTGLGHYFGVDAIWIKIALLIAVFAGFGTGILIYIILWAVTPNANTTSEKIKMTGDPVTITNIEKKFREEYDSVSEKLKNANENVKAEFDQVSEKFKASELGQKFNSSNKGSNLGDVIISIFKAFAKVIGAFIVMIATICLVAFCITGIIMMFSSTMPDNFIMNHISTPIGLETPLWIQGILFMLVFGIPFFFLLILGLKLLVTDLKSIGNVAKYTLLALWIIALGILISLGINEASQLSYDGKVVEKATINIKPTDTLYLKFKNNDYYSKDIDDRDDFKLTQDENNHEIIYSNDVSIQIMKTDALLPYLQVEKLAKGKNANEARQRAEKIKYNFKIDGNNLILDNYLLNDVSNKFRGQSIELFLYLPKGTLLKPDSSLQDYDRSDDGYFNLHYSSENYSYKVGNTQIKCLNCPDDENEWNDVENDSIIDMDNVNMDTALDSISSITLNKDGILVKKDNKKEVQVLKINKDGINIKTN
jgi:phage shock protein PspC (stress-responsive transcriptional regulator)